MYLLRRAMNTAAQRMTLTELLWIDQPSGCKLFAYADNLPHSAPGSFPFSYQSSISLSQSAGNACEGAFLALHVVITATPYEKCSS